MSDANKYREGADDKAHGTHGRGVGNREKDLGEKAVEPGVSKSSNPPGTMGDPGWGSEASGGSTIDRTSPKKSNG